MSLPHITIRLIKESADDKSIKIKPTNSGFLWTYKDNNVYTNEVMNLYTISEVMNTFDVMMNTLLLDDEPFTSIQLDIPALPSVLYRMNNVKMVIFDIRRLIVQALEKIPYYMS